VIIRVVGALVRALAVILLVATPSIILPSTPGDTRQIAMLVAILAAIATFAEYASKTSTLIEFREAPPVNRIRFLALFACVFFLRSFAVRSPQQHLPCFLIPQASALPR
jgi:hypothetical protein